MTNECCGSSRFSLCRRSRFAVDQRRRLLTGRVARGVYGRSQANRYELLCTGWTLKYSYYSGPESNLESGWHVRDTFNARFTAVKIKRNLFSYQVIIILYDG